MSSPALTQIPIAKPLLGEEEADAAREVILSGKLASGEKVLQFEEAFARYCGVSHAIAVSNGTTALHATLLANGIGPGDEVIVPDFTFIATATAVSMCGAKPVFADIEADTYSIDPDSVLERLSKKTKAIIGVHLFGLPFDCTAIGDICNDRGIPLIEDAAQAHGAMFQGKKTGSFGACGCFSFYPTKNMTTGEGGMVTTNDAGIAERLRILINHGQKEKYLHTVLGYNYRMTDISAAIGLVQLTKINQFNEQRNKNAEILDSGITAKGVSLPLRRKEATHVFHQYVVKITEGCSLGRDEFAKHLSEKKIGSGIHYPIPLHKQPVYFQKGKTADCPVSEQCSREVLSLPVHPGLSRQDLERICSVVNEVT